MTQAQNYCMKHKPIAYYSGFSGLEIYGIEHGIDDYVYCVSGAWGAVSKRECHKLKIYYNGSEAYFMLRGEKVALNECIRMGV